MLSLGALSCVFLSILIRNTHALVGCDAAGCPVDSSDNTLCTLGGIQLTAVGIDNFTAPLADQETLTWTVGERSVVSESDAQMEQNFYLGSPPSLQLHSQSAFGGCALFFKDAANDLSFLSTGSVTTPLSRRKNLSRSLSVENSAGLPTSASGLRGNGTCADALGTPCVNALLSQASTLMSMSNATGPFDDNFCQRFANALQNSAPKNCSAASPSGVWGTIMGKSMLGTNSTPPIPQGDCHPTTGQGYELSLVATIQRPLSTTTTFHSGFRGVVPILTIILPTTGSNKPVQQAYRPAPALSCLEPVGVDGNTYSSKGSVASAAAPRSRNPWIVATVVVGAIGALQLY